MLKQDLIRVCRFDKPMEQIPVPQKQGATTSSPKIVLKKDPQSIEVIQRTNKGYMRYILNNKTGVATDKSNYGDKHELIRLIDARQLASAYLYKDLINKDNVVVGTFATYKEPSLNTNAIEGNLLDIYDKQDNRSISNKADMVGSGIYSLKYGGSISIKMTTTFNPTANLVYLVTTGSVEEVNIYINNHLTKTFNPKEGMLSSGECKKIEFTVPTKAQTSEYIIKIEAKGSSGLFYPCCINFVELKNFNGEHIDCYKCIGSKKGISFITQGANDYAMADNNSKWFGSYHGGEELLECKLNWIQNFRYQKRDSDLMMVDIEDLATGAWRVLTDKCELYERTRLLGRAEMISLFDFTEDGTINMKMSFTNSDTNPILFNTLYTSLTCTAPSFKKVLFPQFIDIVNTPLNEEIPLYLTEGFVSQLDETNGLQLNVRFNMFKDTYNRKGSFILHSSYYEKLYYGVINNSRDIKVPHLQFNKSLDFIIR